MELALEAYSNQYGKAPHPMAQLDACEAALARYLGVEEAPWIPPSDRFYFSNYMKDGRVAAGLRTAYGQYKSAAKQLNSFRRTQRPDGSVPGVSHPPKKFKVSVNPERRWSSQPHIGNDYLQSPVWASGVLELYETAATTPPASAEQAIDPDEFLLDIYPDVRRFYQHIIDKRQVAERDPRVFLLHPHEANRDSGPEYDEWKREELERQLGRLAVHLRRKPRMGEHMPYLFNQRNRVIDYAGSLAINRAGYKAGWDPARIHDTTEFIDVWFNYLLYENYEAMSELATRLNLEEDRSMFAGLALDLESAMNRLHYFPEARGSKGGFYSIYNGQPQYKETIGNLMPLLSPNLSEKQLRSIITLANEGFDTPFPWPSVAAFDMANWDPHYEEKDRHWRSPTWAVANRMGRRGLKKHAARSEIPQYLRGDCEWWSYRLHKSNLGMVAVTGSYAEHYDPLTGMGQRLHRSRGHVFGIPDPEPLESAA